MERVQKIISNAGYCSRRKAEELIENGLVKVNGKTISLGDKADTEKDKITVEGILIKPVRKIYIALNKPKGYITTNSDLFNRKKIIDLIKIKERVYPVGRLDRDATGLILLTNDGDFSNKIMHPRYEVKKSYIVKLDRNLEETDIEKIKKGIRLEEGLVRARASFVDKEKANVVEITLHQGMHKVVKRIFKHLGFRVKELSRVKIGNVLLDVNIGRYRNLTKKEINFFKKH